MYLSKIEIFGFKSFADKTTIEFDSGVSAIVGPNGSGKSNIVDALRWVLGEQGDKILRSGKREDVVFNGTKFRKPLSVAEVVVTIQNNKNILPTEYSEVQIARRFYRSGETEYFLNGTKVRLKDIKELFIDTGIGPDAYSVIELKMVETILSDVKHERRKLFEEAAGVVSYKHNRDLTFNRLDAVHESLLRVNDIIREKQRNVNALERQAKRNEEAKIVSEELRSLELKTGKFEFEYLIREINDIKAREDDNINLKSRLASEIRINDEQLDKLRAELSELEDKLGKMSSEYNSVREKSNSVERENLVLEEKINNINSNNERLQKENEELNAAILRNKDKSEQITEKLKVLANTIYISEGSLSDKKSKVESRIRIINEKKNEMLELGKKARESINRVNEKKEEYQKNKINFENNLKQLEKISEINSGLILQSENTAAEISSLEVKINKLREDLKVSDKLLKEKETGRRSLEAGITEKEKEILELDIEYHKLKNKADHLKELSDNFNDYAEGIKYLIKEEGVKNISTILDAIEVEDKFKIPIETALGEISNYIILEDSKELDGLIDKLSDNRKGKVTFILNDLLNFKSFEYFSFIDEKPSFIKEKGVYGFADEYVRCIDERHLKLMKYILDEYVIVDNFNTAKRLSEDNYYKFITLEGDIVTNGFIRAGGKVNEESVRLGRQKVIENIDKSLNEISERSEVLKAEKEKIKKQLDNTGVDPQRKISSDLSDEINRLTNDISKLEFKKEQVNKTVSDNESSYETISNSNKELNRIIDEQIKELSKVENEQFNLDKEVLFLTDEFNEIEKNFSQESADYNNFNIEFTKLKNEHKIEEQNSIRISNTISFNQKQIRVNSENITDNNEKKKLIEDTLEQNKNRLTLIAEEVTVISAKLDAEKVLFEDKKNEQHRIDLIQRQNRLDFDAVSQKLINSQVRIKENEIKSSQVKDYILRKYEKDISLNESIDAASYNFQDFDLMISRKEIDDLSERLKKLGGGYQQLLFEDFENEKAELEKLTEQRHDLLESEKDIRKTIERINKEARERFLATFENIRENFINIFKELFSEGDEANLRIVNEVSEDGKTEDDPLEAKIEIIAKPRGKRPTSIELLSGGEKTLTAIALLFAIYLVKPSPFCVLDEVDAPLDVANLGRFNKMIRKFSDNTQFILITHNERTMESVDRLYGVTMQEAGITTIVETKFKSDEKLQA
ncbi:MAG: chromosome segregation protein SMC [Bacteroidetes bacterium]|nr:chromosome segregation protein SMC [Bacteroidota bacterium]